MLRPARRFVRRVMERTGLIGPYYRWLERRQAHAFDEEAVDDGRPMPPAELVVLVSGPSRRWFSERGRSDADKFRTLAAAPRARVAEMAAAAFEVVEIIPGGSDEPAQAVAVLRARA